MTTKDQAIAPNKQFIEKFDELLPAPDCRTCERRYPEVDGAYGGYTNKCDMKCTNGDQYQPAPAVVLWRTE